MPSKEYEPEEIIGKLILQEVARAPLNPALR